MILILGFLTFNQCLMWRDDRTLWTYALNHDPKNELAKAKQDKAIYYPKRKNFDYKALTRAIDQAPFKAENYFERGKALFEEGDYFLAFSDLNEAIKIDPLNYMAYNLRGELYGLKGDSKKALGDFNKAIALKPDNAIAYMQEASILGNMHAIDQALMFFD